MSGCTSDSIPKRTTAFTGCIGSGVSIKILFERYNFILDIEMKKEYYYQSKEGS